MQVRFVPVLLRRFGALVDPLISSTLGQRKVLRWGLTVRGLGAVVVRYAVAGAAVQISPEVRIRSPLASSRGDTLQVPRVLRA